MENEIKCPKAKLEYLLQERFPDRDFTEDFWASVQRFINQGLSEDEIVQSMEVACSKELQHPEDLTRYFFGVCWNRARHRSTRFREGWDYTGRN